MPISQIDTAWSFHGLRALILENATLRVAVLPEAGGRIYQITYKPLDVDLLWNHPRMAPSKLPFGANYDDNWCGGWDELIPNNIPENINGEAYPDHGEVWAVVWSFVNREESSRVSTTLSCHTRISDVYVEKTIALGPEESCVEIDYLLRKGPGPPLPILWNLHIPFAVSEAHRLQFPRMKASLEPSYLGTLEGSPVDFTWPLVSTPDGELDLSVVPHPSARQLHLVYGHDFGEGRCGVRDTVSDSPHKFCLILRFFGLAGSSDLLAAGGILTSRSSSLPRDTLTKSRKPRARATVISSPPGESFAPRCVSTCREFRRSGGVPDRRWAAQTCRAAACLLNMCTKKGAME